MCSKRELFRTLLPLLRHVVPLNNGNYHLTTRGGGGGPLYLSKIRKMSYFDPYILAKSGKYRISTPIFHQNWAKCIISTAFFFFTLVAFRVDGWWGTSLSKTWPSTPPGHCAREALPHAFNIGMSKCGKGNPTTMKHIYNESENLYESCDVAFHSNDWWNLP